MQANWWLQLVSQCCKSCHPITSMVARRGACTGCQGRVSEHAGCGGGHAGRWAAGLRTRLLQVQRYLELVLAGQLPVNHGIVYQLQARILTVPGPVWLGMNTVAWCLLDVAQGVRVQDVFNLLPNLGVEALSRSFTVQSNDMMLAIYLASLTRSVLALHSLIDNKVPSWLQPCPPCS